MSVCLSAHGPLNKEVSRESLDQTTLRWRRLFLGNHPRRALFRSLVIVMIGSLIVDTLILPVRISGNSMSPTYQPSEFLVTDRVSYRFSSPRLGDVVVLRTNQEGITIIKRVVGLPGDRIEMLEGRLQRNGEWLDEPYVVISGGWTTSETVLGVNEYWVVGDNRSVSTYGKVHRGNILGKVW